MSHGAAIRKHDKTTYRLHYFPELGNSYNRLIITLFQGQRKGPGLGRCAMHTAADQMFSLQKLTLTGVRERIAKKSYTRATGVSIPYFDAGLASVRQKGWRTYEVPCGHDVMLDMPERLVENCGKPPEHAVRMAQPTRTSRDVRLLMSIEGKIHSADIAEGPSSTRSGPSCGCQFALQQTVGRLLDHLVGDRKHA